jgi:hypothetical protein
MYHYRLQINWVFLTKKKIWTAYVIRRNGAPHIRSLVLNLTWYQYFLLDVITLMALAVRSLVFITVQTLAAVLTRICDCVSQGNGNDVRYIIC